MRDILGLPPPKAVCSQSRYLTVCGLSNGTTGNALE